jgi:hypothetical protein
MNVIEGMRERYSHLNLLLIVRSVERSQSAGELFDILEDVPKEYPLVWDDNTRRWVVTDDLLQSKSYQDAEAEAEQTGD